MKVVVFEPFNPYGGYGTEKNVDILLKMLKADDVTIHGTVFGQKNRGPAAWIEEKRVYVHNPISFARIVRNQKNYDADAIIIPVASYHALYGGLIPEIPWERVILQDQAPFLYANPVNGKYHEGIFHRIMRNAPSVAKRDAHVIVYNRIQGELFKRLGFENVHVLRLPMVIPQVKPPVKDEIFRIVFMGRLEPDKRPHLLRKLAKEIAGMPDVRMEIMGRGILEFLLRRLPESTKHHGYLNDPKKHEILQRAHLLVQPSTHESTPLTYSVMEALINGMKVISTEFPVARAHRNEVPLGVRYVPKRGFVKSVLDEIENWRMDPVNYEKELMRIHKTSKREFERNYREHERAVREIIR